MRFVPGIASPLPRPPLRVGMLIASTSPTGGGVGEAMRSLALALHHLPHVSVEIFAPDDGQARRDFDGIPVKLAPVRGPSWFAYAPRLVPEMLESDLDVLHVHGLWMYISAAARRWAKATGRPYVVSPHGMLDPWALRHNAPRKKLARLLYEDAHLENAACLHALCRAESDAIRLAGLHRAVAIIPNGVHLPAAKSRPAPWRLEMPREAKACLFLGRVTPKKQVVELIRAFARCSTRRDWHLVVVGPAQHEYEPDIRSAAADAPCRDRIHVVGPAYDEARASAYASADLFILPSLSEGLPMAALEAFGHGLPALLTPQCNLPEAFDYGAALEIEPTEHGIAAGLERMFTLSDSERTAMGMNGVRLVSNVFNWDAIARQMADLYTSLAQPEVSLSA